MPETTAATTIEVAFARSERTLARTIRTSAGTFSSRQDRAPVSEDPLGDWWQARLLGTRPQSERSTRPTLRTVDLFCGPGGLALGLQLLADEMGIDVVSAAAVDQDDAALRVYAANHHARRRVSRSVSTLIDYQVDGKGDRANFVYEPELLEDDWQDLPGNVDVVLAGPPCQGHSNLNNRTRRSDRRNELYLSVPAMAMALQAPIVIIENVPAVVHDSQQVVGTTARLLQDAGYHLSTGVLSASDLGWPQSRQRFFLVARRGVRPLDIKACGAALRSEPRPVMWALADLVEQPFDDRMHLRTELTTENQRRIDFLFDHDLHDLPLSERPECHRDGTTYNSVYGRMYPDRPAPTITTGFLTPGRGRYIHPTQRRVLTPREAARLQGFPDDYEFHVDPTEPATKQQLGKWIGDAVPLPLGHAAALAALGPGWPEGAT